MSETNRRQPNADQLKVINELDSNVILFASAGTGKTFTVAQRVKQIIETERALPLPAFSLDLGIGFPFSSVGMGGTEAGLPPMGTQAPTADVVPIRDGRISSRGPIRSIVPSATTMI